MDSQFSIFVLLNLGADSVEVLNFEILAEVSDTAVLVQLPLEWNTYLLFNSDIVNFVGKIDEGVAESIV